MVDRPGDILEALRDRGPLPVAELAETRPVSRSTTVQEVSDLKRDGLVVQGVESRSRGGRPSPVIELAASLRFLTIDVGTATITTAATDGYLSVESSFEEGTDLRAGPTSVIDQIERCARRLTGDSEGPVGAMAVGVAIPSPVSIERGEPVDPALMPGWDGFPVREQLSVRLGVPVAVDKDANLMALGERHRGAARGFDDCLFVKLGSGISCGIVANGALYRGHDGAAGDIGHVRAGDWSTPCHCGRLGCLEAQVGTEALGARAIAIAQSGESLLLAERLTSTRTLSAADLAWASSAGDPAAARVIREAGSLLGEALSALVSFFNPERIVLGGPTATIGPALLTEIHSAILNRSSPLSTARLTVTTSALGKMAGPIGAARIASDAFLANVAQSR